MCRTCVYVFIHIQYTVHSDRVNTMILQQTSAWSMADAFKFTPYILLCASIWITHLNSIYSSQSKESQYTGLNWTHDVTLCQVASKILWKEWAIFLEGLVHYHFWFSQFHRHWLSWQISFSLVSSCVAPVLYCCRLMHGLWLMPSNGPRSVMFQQ